MEYYILTRTRNIKLSLKPKCLQKTSSINTEFNTFSISIIHFHLQLESWVSGKNFYFILSGATCASYYTFFTYDLPSWHYIYIIYMGRLYIKIYIYKGR